MKTESDSVSPTRTATALIWLPLPLFLTAIVVLWELDWREAYESASLLFVFNLVFFTLGSLFIMLIAGRSFLKSGDPGLLMMGTAALLWGGSAFAATAGGHTGNYNITIHNTGVLFSALGHLLGVCCRSER